MQTLDALKEQVKALTTLYTGDAGKQLEAFIDKVLVTYNKRTLEQLTQLFTSENNNKTTALEEFLKQNWILVNGTPLCPTAMPETPLTSLLCDIAEYVAENQNSNKTPLVPIQYLMPTVGIESISDNYPDFTAQISLKSTLKTHILGQGGVYLVPIKVLQTLDTSVEHDTTEKRPQLNNPYYDYQSHPPEAGFINEEEYQRLLDHSPLTRSLRDAKQEYDLLANKDNHLLGQLRLLCQQLGFNSVSGIGSEENAGSGVYSPIIHFMEYYNQLDKDEKNRIPAELKQEIDTLYTLVTNKDEREDGTLGTDRCIAIRRAQLIKAMECHEPLLIDISLNLDKKDSAINQAKQRFDKAKNELLGALNKNNYANGQDNLGLNRSLLNNLKMSFRITSRADLDALRAISVNELNGFLKEPQLRQQIMQQIANLENLVLFIMGLTPDKLQALFTGIREELMPLITSSKDLGTLLITLDSEKCRIVCEVIKDRLKSGYDFGRALMYLSPEHRTTIYEIMKDKLPEIITSAPDFKNVLKFLSPQQRTTIYEIMKDKLLGMITTASDFNNVLKFLSPEQRTTIYEAMKDKLPEIITSGEDFEQTLMHLSPEQRAAIYEIMKNKLPAIITSGYDFSVVLMYLSPEQRTATYNHMKDKLLGMITSSYTFNVVLTHLPPEQRTAVFEAMKDQLPKMITSGYEFTSLLRRISPEQCMTVCEIMKDKLPKMIRTGYQLREVLENLSPTQCMAVCKTIREKLPNFVNNATYFKKIIPIERRAIRQHYAASLNAKEAIEAMTNSADYLAMTKQEDFCRAILKIDTTHKQVILSLITAPEKLYKAASHAPLYLKSCFDALKTFHDKPRRSARDKQVLLRSLDNAKDMYCEKVLSKDRSGLSKAVRLLLMTVTNFIAALTFGIAHYVHYQNTGEVGFFVKTRSATKLNANHRALIKDSKLDTHTQTKDDDNPSIDSKPTPA